MEVRIEDHPLRTMLSEELHARPFQPMTAPGRALLLAFKPVNEEDGGDFDAARLHLLRLLDLHDVPHPAPEARQYTAEVGGIRLKWEHHTEFVSYMLIAHGPTDAFFHGRLIDNLDIDWLNDAPGVIIAAAEVELIEAPSTDPSAALHPGIVRQFDSESLAAALIIDGNAVALCDFRLDQRGFTRFALVVTGTCGPRRLGRAVQRLLEIEVYRAMSMLALPLARKDLSHLSKLERDLTDLMTQVSAAEEDRPSDKELLDTLSGLSAQLEARAAASAYRMDASRAYSRIVDDRLTMMKEVSLRGRQTFREFMSRRYDPAMRTVEAARERQAALSERAARMAELLRTRVSVHLEAQNQEALESMNRRAALQLRLQATVEGLSVVAISYYAVSLLAYLLAPVGYMLVITKPVLMSLLTVPVVLLVWWSVRRMRKRLENRVIP